MATSGADTKKADDFRHTCALCMEPYRGRNPKLLPCFHTFCLPCLTELAENVTATATSENLTENCKKAEVTAGEENTADGEGEKIESHEHVARKESRELPGYIQGDEETREEGGGDEEEARGGCGAVTSSEAVSHPLCGRVFLCPTCRAPVTVPQAGVAALQTNFYLDYEDTGDHCSKPLPCEMCQEGEGEVQEASFTCDKCRQWMCRTCRRLHDRFTDAREHHVRTLNADDLPGGKEQVKALCSVHREQELCFHCQKCDVSICLHCKLTSHEGHVTEDMATAVLRAKQELAVLVAKADKQLQVSQAYLSRMERDELELKRQKQEVKQRVNSRYDVITTWATWARDEVLEALEAKGQTALNKSRSEMTAARVAMETINGLVSRASRQTANGPDVVLLKNELQAALLTDDAFDHQSKLAAREEHLTFLSSQADDTALDLGTVRAYVGELVPDGDEGSEGSSRFSLRQLAGELQKAKEETAESILKLHAELKADLSKLKSTLKGVAFHARCNTSLTSKRTLIFNSVQSNEGNGYDGKTGIFTAPMPGVYMFLVSVRNLSLECHTSNVSILVQECERAATHGSGTRTAHTVVKLKKGEQVWVLTKEKKFWCDFSTSFFTGALIQAQVP